MDKKTKDEEIFEMISSLKPEHIPPQYVSSGRVYDTDGGSYDVSCEELEDIMTSPYTFEEQGIDSIRLFMDIEKIVNEVVTSSESLLSIIPE